ncbi:hypothetical protein BKA70DRAFT_1430580 [Coprinopsis sp. MPI-PUGE-AT-0042]|nr:hypothetical protein BKA70DRAFT_1430580 [Coprinopsis sp. MPI-PUGE-AT-0042]
MTSNEIFRLVAVPLRFWALSLKPTQCKHILDCLGAFKPLLSNGQSEMVKQLLKTIQSGQPPSDLHLLQFIHCFLLDIFTVPHPLTKPISSLVEQLIVLRCLSAELQWQWRSASWMYSIICLYVRVGRTVVVQAACLGGQDAKYMLSNAMSNRSPDNGPEEAQPHRVKADDREHKSRASLGVAPGDEANAAETMAVDQLKDQLEDAHGGGLMTIALVVASCSPATTSSIKILHELSPLIDEKKRDRVYGRLAHLRGKITSVAKSEPFSSRCVWSSNPGEFTLTCGYVQGRTFVPDKTRFLSFHSQHYLSPDFSDDWNLPSLLHLPRNAKLFSHAIDGLILMLNSQPAHLDKFLDKSQEFLGAFAQALYLNTGIPPHAHQAIGLRYTADGEGDRHFMLDGNLGLLIWNCAGKGYGYAKKARNSVWHLPAQLTISLIIFLGVYRPVETHFVKKRAMRDGTPQRALDLLLTHIFCNPKRRANKLSKMPIVWSPDNLDVVLLSGPLQLSAYAHRILFSAIIDKCLAPLVHELQHPSILDDQGQHTKTTSLAHYAVLPLQYSTGFHFSGLQKQVLVCQALHAMNLLDKPTRNTPQSTAFTQDAAISVYKNIPHAFNVARNAAAVAYGLASLPRLKVEVVSRDAYLSVSLSSILKATCRGCAGGIGFTGRDLLDVALALVCDSGGAMWRSSALQIAAYSATMMLAAISEWLTGVLTPYQGQISPLSVEWKAMTAMFEGEQDVVTRFPEWDDFVLGLAASDLELDNGTDEVDLPLPMF